MKKISVLFMYFFAYFLFHINDIEHSGDIEQKRIFKNVKKSTEFFFQILICVFYIICAVADELEKKQLLRCRFSGKKIRTFCVFSFGKSFFLRKTRTDFKDLARNHPNYLWTRCNSTDVVNIYKKVLCLQFFLALWIYNVYFFYVFKNIICFCRLESFSIFKINFTEIF